MTELENQYIKSLDPFVVNRDDWEPGPWDGEPDYLQFNDKATGLDCLIVRSGVTGALCGYVGCHKGHPWYEKDYSDIDAGVHGGLTYSGRCQGPICHVPAPSEPDDIWWLGFDCAHAFDIMPALGARLKKLYEQTGRVRQSLPGDVYRDIEYVKAECADLALQVAEAGK